MQSSLLSLDHFTQQQDYQRSLLINNSSSSSKHKKHSRKHRHKHSDKCRSDKCGHRHHRHGHSHSHRSKKSRKDYGSVNDQCAVCLDDEHELDTRLFPCKHVFHGECLIEWVRQGESFTCPLCRQQITHFFNLSNNDEINDQLIQIWNDYYTNIDTETKSSSTAKLIDTTTTSGSSTTTTPATKSLDLTMIETDAGRSTQAIEKEGVLSLDIDEIARIKNETINHGLAGFETLDGSPINTSTSSAPISPMSADNIAFNLNEPESIETLSTKIEETVSEINIVPQIEEEIMIQPKAQSVPPVAEVKQVASVWQSTQGKISSQGLKQSVRSLLPESTFISLLFDQFISKSVVNSVKQLKELELKESESTVLFNENEIQNIIHLDEDIEYQLHLDRINGGLSMFETNEINNNNNDIITTTSTSTTTEVIKEPPIPEDMDPSGFFKIGKENEEILSNTLSNMEAGAYAGIGCGLASFGVNATQRTIPFAIRSSLAPVLRETVPGVAAFFTIYEHLKTHMFQCDGVDKSHIETFGERFISAGIASSIAIVPRSSIGISALRYALPLRFAAFFGSFELCKDITSQFKLSHGDYNELNLLEIGGSAAIGSVIASTVHYPVTQLIEQGSSSGITNISSRFGILNAAGAAAGTAGIYGNGSDKKAILENMYRGYVPHLKKFVPPTVVCSCAFEFAKRAVNQRKD